MCLNKLIDKFWDFIAEQDRQRIANTKYPEGVKAYKDIPYLDDGDEYHLLDVYVPEDKVGQKIPTMLDIHGGGWYYGKKEINQEFNYIMALKGFQIISGNYRLARAYTLKDIVQDVFAQLKWIEDNAEKYNFDLDNLVICGDSAGGWLAAMTVAIIKNKHLQEVYGVSSTLNFKAVSLICAVVNPTRYNWPILSAYLKPLYGKGYTKCGFYKESNFLKYIPEDMPPIFMNTAKGDIFKSGNIALYKTLKKKNFEDMVYMYYPEKMEGEHKIEHVYNILNPYYDVSKETNDRMAEFFLENLNK